MLRTLHPHVILFLKGEILETTKKKRPKQYKFTMKEQTHRLLKMLANMDGVNMGKVVDNLIRFRIKHDSMKDDFAARLILETAKEGR